MCGTSNVYQGVRQDIKLYDNAKCVVHPTGINSNKKAKRLYDNAKCVVHPTTQRPLNLVGYCMTMQNVWYIQQWIATRTQTTDCMTMQNVWYIQHPRIEAVDAGNCMTMQNVWYIQPLSYIFGTPGHCMTMQNVWYIPTIIKACHNVDHDRMLVRCRTIQTLSRTYEIICKNYDARRVAEKN